MKYSKFNILYTQQKHTVTTNANFLEVSFSVVSDMDPRSLNSTRMAGSKVPDAADLPPLFRCKSYIEIRSVISSRQGTIEDIFQGYNALHWYCNAKSTCPKIIQQLLQSGIEINAVDRRPHSRGGIRHTALGYACRNANIKAIATLLRNGADPSGLAKLNLPRKDTNGK